MKIRGGNRWLIYVLISTINVILLSFYIIWHQKGSGIGDELHGGVAIYFNENKPKELLGYLVGAIILFSGFMISCFGFNNKLRSNNVLKVLVAVSDGLRLCPRNMVNYIHMFVIPILILLFIKDLRVRVFIQSYVVLYLLFVAITPFLYSRLNGGVALKRLYNGVGIVIMLLLVLQVGYIFSDHIIGRPKIINEFYNIPEQTRVGRGYVDNTEYLNQHYLVGYFPRWDIEKPVYDGGYVSIILNRNSPLYPTTDNATLYYSGLDKRLYLNGVMDLNALELYGNYELYEINNSNDIRQRLISQKKFTYSKQEKKFLSDNQYEVHWQVLDRYMFHHHSFILSPVSDLELGVPINKIKAQYGVGNIVIFRWVLNVLGGISFENWLRVNALFYIIYYLMLGLILYGVFEKRFIAVLVFVASVTVFNMHGYEFMILAPGDSPWRNFFDIVILYLLYKYQNNKNIYIVGLVFILGVLSVYINPQIGLMIVLAAMASFTIYLFLENKLNVKWGIAFALMILVSVYVFIRTSTEGDLAVYYMKGVIGFPISILSIAIILATILFGYFALIYLMRNKFITNLLPYMYLFFYAQVLMVYYVWHADINGLLSRSHIYILAVAYIIYNLFKSIGSKARWQNTIYFSLTIISFVLYANAAAKVVKDKVSYNKIFKNHKTYTWQFDRAKIESTANPAYFYDAVSLINKYGRGDSIIYIISRYDNILPFLANKVSGMPFHDLKWYNMTDKELNKSISLIKNRRPQYIYVDKDINRNFNEDIIWDKMPAYGYLHEESVWRAERLKLMASIFEKVSGDYRLIDSSKIMSVYKRNDL